MTRTSREALVSMMTDIPRGRINRREFLARTIALGVSSGAAMALLEACGGSSGGSSSGPITLTLWDYFQTAGKGYLSVIVADLKQKIIQGAASKQLPDIVVIDNPDHSAFSSMGILAGITSEVSAWGQS